MTQKKIIALFLVFVLCGFTFAQFDFFGLFGGGGDQKRAESVLKSAAGTLGWSAGVAAKDGDRGAKMLTITPDGSDYQKSQAWGGIAVVAKEEDARTFLDVLQENGMLRSTYQGRDAIIMHKGDKICKAGGQVGMILELTKIIFGPLIKAINPEANLNEMCAESYGTMAWRCGNYVFFAQDQSEAGTERSTAAAIYAAAEKENLCGMGDTVVILAQTADTRGGATLSKYQQITQDINSYYGKNAYGRVSFTYTFKDADGSSGSHDWYTVPGTQASYLDKETEYAIAATKEAFKGADIENNVHIDRVVVVYSGDGQQVDKTRPLATLRSTRQGGFNIDVDSLNGKRTINVGDLIVVSEYDPVGTWAHEFGHTLYSKTADFHKIGDRYNYDGKPARQYGTISYWGLMGSGNWWGNPSGANPTHMCGFTKEDAGWLRYRDMTMNTGYAQKSLENLNAGDFILRFDDPTSADPHDYMIVEPRDAATGAYGAPATGVAIYYVSYSNNHYVVNFMTTQQGANHANLSVMGAGSNATKRTRDYWLPTLYGASTGGPTEWVYPDAHLKVVLVGESFSPYSAKVTLEEFNVTKMKAATAAPTGAGEPTVKDNAIVGVNSEEPMPDLDLHAYDGAGHHTGVNYDTGMYENNIPGAIASGDLKDAKEWIFVPEDANVRFEVSYKKAAEFVANNPRYASLVAPMDYHMEYVKYDSSGNRYVADGGSGTLGVGATNDVKKPDDRSLSYTSKDIPGFGNNSSGGLCCCLPGLVLIVMGGAILRWQN